MWIVQLTDCHEFLCPGPEGEVTSTPWLGLAGVFEFLESAIDTADFHAGTGNYVVIDLFNFDPTYECTSELLR